MKKISPIFLLFLTYTTYGQLGFCTGGKGLPIFTENFGSGTTQGPALAPGTTTYTYGDDMPHDGEYNLHWRTNIGGFAGNWHNAPDHTPDTEPDGFEGKSLIINAAYAPGAFYRRAVSGLCVNTTFEFSSWIMNILNINNGSCTGNERPVNVSFEIWNAAETAIIASGTTGPIFGTAIPTWTQYAITFTMPPGQTDVVLIMRNNGIGGCGNDLALDDISFRACGDIVTITSPGVAGNVYTSLCQNNIPVNIQLNANSTSPIPNVYQWQQSTDNVTWTDIPGATGSSYNTPNIVSTHYYRTKVAQDVANLSNPTCSTLSDVFSVFFLPKPNAPITNGDVTICSNEPMQPLSVTVGANEHVNWYSALTGGTLLASNTTTFTPATSGTYYAEAYTASSCTSDTRTPVTLTIRSGIVLGNDQTIHLCAGQTTTLDAGVSGTGITYLWQPGGEITQTITVSTGMYMVTATTADGCFDSMQFNVISHQIPIISDVVIDGTTITIVTQGDEFYEYSLDGIHYQNSNMFFNVRGGVYTAYVRDAGLCGQDEFEFLLIVFPKFFTPNNDTYHDTWEVEGMQYIPEGRAAIFDRYGKLITVLTNAYPKWDGTYNDRELPSTDYWYLATLRNGQEFRGHFSLKR